MIFILFCWFTFQFYPWLSFLKPLNCPRIPNPSQFYFSLTNKIFHAMFNNNPHVLLVHVNTQNKKEEISHGYKERTNLELKVTRGRSSSDLLFTIPLSCYQELKSPCSPIQSLVVWQKKTPILNIMVVGINISIKQSICCWGMVLRSDCLILQGRKSFGFCNDIFFLGHYKFAWGMFWRQPG